MMNPKKLNKLTEDRIADTDKVLVKYYKRAMNTAIKEFELTYLHLLRTVGADKEPTPADLYKLDKYWAMEAQVNKILQNLGAKEVNLLNQTFIKQYKGVYETLALADKQTFNKIDDKVANQVINRIWCADGKLWRERVWNNTALLQETLNETLVDCLITGKQPAELKKQLMKRFNVSYHRANSLVRTEMAHIQNASTQQRYSDIGVKKVQVWGDADERRCEVCGKYHGKIFYTYETANLPPYHVNCRCCILPVIEKK